MFEIKEIVKQEEKHGCVAACIATILQTDYRSIIRCFKTDFEKQGLDLKHAANFLAGYGFDIVRKDAFFFGNGYATITSRMLKSFADIHIVSAMHYAETYGKNITTGHALILTNKGKLFDPVTGTQKCGGYLYVDQVIGLYYPSGWEFKGVKKKKR